MSGGTKRDEWLRKKNKKDGGDNGSDSGGGGRWDISSLGFTLV